MNWTRAESKFATRQESKVNWMSVTQPRIDALTGLRFLAALFVYLHHHPKPDYFPSWLITFFTAGYNGVTFFFVLSGCVIALNYFEGLSRPTPSGLVRYAVARFARIYPLYLLVLLYVWLKQDAPLTSDFGYHVLALQAWSPDFRFAYAFNGPGWSIGIEFFLYACFPLIVILLARLKGHAKGLWFLAFGVLAYLIGIALFFQLTGRASLPITDPESAHRWLYRTPITRLGDFLLGVIAALLYRNRNAVHSRFEFRWVLGTYSAIALMVIMMILPDNLNSVFSWDALYAPVAFLLILGLTMAPRTIVARFLSSRPLVVLGEASFALYLIHIPLIDVFDIYSYTDYAPWIAILLWIAFAGICILLAIGLNRYVETPLRRLINNGSERLFTRRSAVR